MEQTTKNTALLVMDMQAEMLKMLPDNGTFIANVATAIAAARSKGMPVIYVTVGFRPGAPEISSNNKTFARAFTRDRWTPEFVESWMKIHPDLAPQEGDITVTKRRVSAFTGSDLEVVLRGQNVQSLVLTGWSTSGVVLSTTREAADKDFQLTILADCCADPDPETHQLLTTKIFTRQAEVINVADWTKAE